jgi:DNA-binding transcriptional LysR family regulator
LEEELGVALLERQARGVKPTREGQLFYEHVAEGLDQIALGMRELQRLSQGEAGSLGIATGGTTIKHFMTDSVVAFRQRYPNVSLNFHSVNSHQRCIEALRNEQADLAFISVGADIRGIEQRPVVEMPWVLVVPADDDRAKEVNISYRDLVHIPYISLRHSSTSQHHLETLLRDKGIEYQASTTVDDWDTAIQFVSMGLGYAITPQRHANHLSKELGIAAVPIRDLPPVVFGWATRRWKSLPKVARDFIEVFKAHQQ